MIAIEHATFTLSIFSLTLRPPPTSTLFPYTTLFRSRVAVEIQVALEAVVAANRRARIGYALPARGHTALARRTSERAHIGLTRSEEHTSELQSQSNLVCRLLLEKKKKRKHPTYTQHS